MTALLASTGQGGLQALRKFLTGAEFTEQAVCRRTGFDSIYDFHSIREGRSAGIELRDRLDLLIRLFMDVELLERRTIESLLREEEVGLLDGLGLLASEGAEPSRCHAAVLLYPTASLWIASDLNVDPLARSASGLAEDAVYPAITRNTRQFLSTLPASPCAAFLELCGGTGIAALLASRSAERTWTVDITERATRFARFNAELNGIGNCRVLQGDLYEPVAGLRFDRIVAHPPYMPSLEQKYVFRDGGEDGEQITRRIISGLPEHLAPGGQCYCTCMLTDRKGAPAEQRIRDLLGGRGPEFDVAVVTYQTFQPTEYYFHLALAGRATLDEVARRHEIFSHLEVERLVYCSMVIARHSGARPGFTVRRQAGAATGEREVRWLMHWENAMAEHAGNPGPLLAACPMPSPGVRLKVSQALREDDWLTEECLLSTGWPFALEAKCPAWIAALFREADGRLTTRQLFAWLKERGMVASDAPEEEFAKLARALIAGGFLRLAEYPVPPGNGLLDTASYGP